MTHIIIFAYIVAIMLAVSALTIHWLSSKGDKKEQLNVSKPFITGLLVMNIYDFIIFYYVHIMTGGPANTLLSIGDCLIALLVVFWIAMSEEADESGNLEKLHKFAKKYFVAYIVIWIVAKILWPKMDLIRVLIDIPYLAVLVVAVIKEIKADRDVKCGKQNFRTYRIFVTVCLFVNYGIYLFSEMGMTLAIFNVIDFTIFVWLVISCANIFFIYKKYFKNIYASRPPVEISAEEAIRNVAIKKTLTARESEILKEIYDGKSNTEIAQKLFISESTVKAHVYNLFRKLETKSRLDAVRIIREERRQGNKE